ncbi:TPR repeat region-containing protein [Nocardia sp. NPDC004722]
MAKWQLGVLGGQGTYWTQQAGKLKTELDAVNNNVGNSAEFIVGKFGNALRDKTVTVRDEGYKVVGALEAAGTAVSSGMQPMDSAQRGVVYQKKEIEDEGFLVGEEGDVVLSLSQLAHALSDKANGTIKLAALQATAKRYSEQMRAALFVAAQTAQDLADAITKAFGELPNSVDGARPVAVTAASGDELGKKIKDSDQIPDDVMAQVDQVLDETQLSDDDKAKLKVGQTVVVPASNLEFTQKLLDSAGPEGFEKLSEQLRAQGPDGEKRAQELAQSFMLLSNQNVKGVEAGGKQIDGGYEQLPQSYRDIISNRVVEQPGSQPGMPGYVWDGNSSKYENPKGVSEFQAGRDHYKNLARLSSALDLADPDYTPGTKLSTELYRQGAFLSEIQTDGRTAALPQDATSLNDTIGHVIDIGSRNTDATSIILTGEGTPDQLGSGYHRDPAVVSLLEHDWPGGIEKSPMKNVLDWMSQDAHVELSPGDEGYQHQLDEATKAGKSAHALADIISTTKSPEGLNNFDSLFNHKSQALPYVAAALSPYVGDMVDVPESITGTHGFGDLNPVQATRVFTLMDDDPLAGKILNGAAIAQSYQYDKAFVLAGGSGDDGDASKYALYSGRLQGLVEGGIAGNNGLHNYDAAAAASHSKDTLGAGFMSAKEFLNASLKAPLKLLPGGDTIITPIVSSVEAYLKDPTVALLNDKPGLSYPTLGIETPAGQHIDSAQVQVPERALAAQRYVMLQAMVDSGKIDAHNLPHELVDNNGLKPFSQIGDADSTKIPTTLQKYGVTGLDQYIIDSQRAHQTVDAVVFGGKVVEPGSQIYVDVLRAGAAPTNVNSWDGVAR